MDSHLITKIEDNLRTLLFNTYEKRQWNVPCIFQHGNQQQFPLCVLQHNIDIIVCDIFENTIYTLYTLLDVYNIDSEKILTNLDYDLQANRKTQVDFIIKTMYDKDSSGKYVRWPVGNTGILLKRVYERVISYLIVRSLNSGETCKVTSQS